MAHLGAGPVAPDGQLVGQPQFFLVLGFFGDAVAQAFAQQFFVGLAKGLRHGQVRTQAGHLVIAQHQPVLFVVDVQPGGHGIDGFAQAALGTFGVVQGLLERTLLVHRVCDVGAQHHHADPPLAGAR